MKHINTILIRIFQYVYYFFFIFWVLTYFGFLLLLPLAAMVLVVEGLTLLGFPGVLALVCAIPLVGYLGLLVHRTPQLVKLFVDTGLGVVKLGFSQYQGFEALVKSVRDS